jgi:hypothetical protein
MDTGGTHSTALRNKYERIKCLHYVSTRIEIFSFHNMKHEAFRCGELYFIFIITYIY